MSSLSSYPMPPFIATRSSHKPHQPLNPFRRKSSTKQPPKPFLVASGILSTDATAQVFGYVKIDRQGRPKLTRREKRLLCAGKSTLQQDMERSVSPEDRFIHRFVDLPIGLISPGIDHDSEVDGNILKNFAQDYPIVPASTPKTHGGRWHQNCNGQIIVADQPSDRAIQQPNARYRRNTFPTPKAQYRPEFYIPGEWPRDTIA